MLDQLLDIEYYDLIQIYEHDKEYYNNFSKWMCGRFINFDKKNPGLVHSDTIYRFNFENNNIEKKYKRKKRR